MCGRVSAWLDSRRPPMLAAVRFDVNILWRAPRHLLVLSNIPFGLDYGGASGAWKRLESESASGGSFLKVLKVVGIFRMWPTRASEDKLPELGED